MADIQGFIQAARQKGLSDDIIEQTLNKKGYKMPMSVGGFVNNIGKSAGNLAGGLASAVFNPVETVKNVGRLGLGAVESLIPGEQGNEKYAKQAVDFYIERYGGIDKIKQTMYEDPVGFLADASMVLGGAGAVTKLIGRLGGSAKVGQVANALNKASRIVDPLSIAGKGVGMATKPFSNAFKGVGKGELLSESILTKGLGNPMKQAGMKSKYGVTPGKLIKKYNLFERTPEAAQLAKEGVMGAYDDLAMKSGATTELSRVTNSIDNAIKKLSSGANKYSESAQAQVAELMKRKAQIMEMAGATTEMPGSTVMMKNPSQVTANISDLTQYRRSLDTDIPKSMFNLDTKGSGTAQGAKQVRDILRENINASHPSLKQLGLDYGALKDMEKVLEGYQSRANNRQIVNFSKLGTAGVGGMLGGIPGAIAGYATEQVTKSPQFLKAASKGIEMVENGKLRVPKVPYSNQIGNVAKAGRFINQPYSSKTQERQQTKQGGSYQEVNQSSKKMKPVSGAVSYSNDTPKKEKSQISLYNPFKVKKLKSK